LFSRGTEALAVYAALGTRLLEFEFFPSAHAFFCAGGHEVAGITGAAQVDG